jgi:hypothetical protein
MHRVCTNCGNYRGREVIDVMKKTIKAAKKAEAKKDAGKPEAEVPETKAEKAEKKEVKPEKKESTRKK